MLRVGFPERTGRRHFGHGCVYGDIWKLRDGGIQPVRLPPSLFWSGRVPYTLINVGVTLTPAAALDNAAIRCTVAAAAGS